MLLTVILCSERFIIALARSLSDDDEFLMDDDDFYHNNVPPSPLKQLFSDEVKMKSFLVRIGIV